MKTKFRIKQVKCDQTGEASYLIQYLHTPRSSVEKLFRKEPYWRAYKNQHNQCGMNSVVRCTLKDAKDFIEYERQHESRTFSTKIIEV